MAPEPIASSPRENQGTGFDHKRIPTKAFSGRAWRVKVAGLDLAALEHNCSGYAVLDLGKSMVTRLECLYGDEEIITRALADGVEVLSVDSPIAREPKLRSVDRAAIRMGFKVLPPNIGYMSRLTMRGWRLYERLTAAGLTVIETHPRSALKSSGAKDLSTLAKMLGVDLGEYGRRHLREDLRDAIVAAMVSLCYVRRSCIFEIKAEDGSIYLIKLPAGSAGSTV